MPASRRSRRISGAAGALRGLLRALFGAAALAAAGAAPAAEFANPDGVAVIIGNGDYAHDDVPDVAYAHRDADAFHRYVVDVLGFDPDNVILERDATLTVMNDVFGNERGHEQSRLATYLYRSAHDVVVFYSGHGVPALEDGKGYLLPVDAAPNTARINGYAIETLYDILGRLDKARSVRVFLDACFSGGSGGGQLLQGMSGPPLRATLRPDVADRMTTLTAATGTQVASWDRKAEHGLFTHHLLDALYGGADAADYGDPDGVVTAAEAKTYLDRHMTRAALRLYRRTQQADLGGDAAAVLAAPEGGFPERPEIELVSADPAEAEKALGLSRADRAAVQTGLESLVGSVGRADGDFGDRTRAALRRWQAAEGYGATGYLTRAQADALAAAGRAEWERDDGAFAAAERANTVAAFEAYLASFPSGRHARDARRLRDAARGPAVGEVFKDCGHCPAMVAVPAGRFTMGSPSSEEGRYDDEGPQHRVTFDSPFAVGVHEVTRGEFGRFVSATGRSIGDCWIWEDDEWNKDSGLSWRSPGFSQSDSHPVVCVSWDDAKAYASWLSRETGEEYRLLSEAEWEYVARAGTTTRFWWGSAIGLNRANCWAMGVGIVMRGRPLWGVSA